MRKYDEMKHFSHFEIDIKIFGKYRLETAVAEKSLIDMNS